MQDSGGGWTAEECLFDFLKIFLANKILKAKKPNKIVYDKLIRVKQICLGRSQDKWIMDCNLDCSDSINWKAVYKLPFCCTKASKLIIFQFKLLYRRLATNDYVKKIGLREDNNCIFCKNEKESLAHLYSGTAGRALFLGRDSKITLRKSK